MAVALSWEVVDILEDVAYLGEGIASLGVGLGGYRPDGFYPNLGFLVCRNVSEKFHASAATGRAALVSILDPPQWTAPSNCGPA